MADNNEAKKSRTTSKTPVSSETETNSTETSTKEKVSSEKEMKADLIIHRNVLWSMGGGAIPLPLVDIVAVSAVQIKMLSEISALYEVSFNKNTGKNLTAALIGGIGTDALGKISFSMLKVFPVWGTAVGIVSFPMFAGASTYAVGRVFVRHFESGGDFLNFDPEKYKGYYKDMLEKGKTLVKKLKPNKKESAEEKAATPDTTKPEASAV
ncbi:MAG: DUF697 domain-containing protein [SAR324 cluster bacterium]|nr:DUF697 domain-containing protein [SAR324 cluster bacterium]